MTGAFVGLVPSLVAAGKITNPFAKAGPPPPPGKAVPLPPPTPPPPAPPAIPSAVQNALGKAQEDPIGGIPGLLNAVRG